jgi:hypothetical protein
MVQEASRGELALQSVARSDTAARLVMVVESTDHLTARDLAPHPRGTPHTDLPHSCAGTRCALAGVTAADFRSPDGVRRVCALDSTRPAYRSRHGVPWARFDPACVR